MQKFNSLKSIPAYLPIVNIDTDMIIPKQFLKTIKKTDLGVYINSDDEIIDIELKVEYYETVVQFIEGVIDEKVSDAGFGGKNVERTQDNGYIISTLGSVLIKTDSNLSY